MADEQPTFQSPLYAPVRAYIEEHSRSGETIRIIVPYIRTDVVKELLDGIDSKVVIITTWDTRDLVSGSSELSLYPYCKDRGIGLYVNSKIHLKVVSAGLRHYVLCTGNMSRRGMHEGGNYEMGVLVKEASPDDRVYFERIRCESRLVDDDMYDTLSKWVKQQPQPPKTEDELDSLVRMQPDKFLVSALPMTRSVDDLVSGYARMGQGLEPSDDDEVAACVFHDLANYGIELGLSEAEFRAQLASRFFAHPFVQQMDSFIDPETYFGRVKEWIQDNCTDVPVPSRRDLTGNVQVLYEWFEQLGDGRYVIDVPGQRSERIRRVG